VLPHAEHALEHLAIASIAVSLAASVIARVLRRLGLRWTWGLAAIPIASVLFSGYARIAAWATALLACVIGARWHHEDVSQGADFAEAAHQRLGMLAMFRRRLDRRRIARRGWIHDGRLTVGQDARGRPVAIPAGDKSGCHTLVVGATGSGKTVTETWIACRLVEHGHAAIVIDPKGDPHLHNQLQAVAERRGVRFLEWTPEGPSAYSPYAYGTPTEVADKALAGEVFTEPHYLRQAQRYLGHAVGAMQDAGVGVTPVSLMAHLDPGQLEVTARQLTDEGSSVVLAYLDSLTDRQKRDLAGVRDRLSILAESDTSRWLNPTDATPAVDLRQAVEQRAVVYFRLDADRRQLLAGMLAAAIVSDLVTLVAHLQRDPVPTVVVVDEFSAVAAEGVARLFGRARSAGVSLVLGTQELADLKAAGDGALREQTLGNVSSLVAHRQNVPESAELVAEMAGTRPVWIATQQTDDGLLGAGPSGRGSRRRGYEFHIHPSRIKQLPTGQAVVITPGSGRPAVARMCHPVTPR